MRRNIFTTLLLGGALGLFVASCSDSQNPLEQTPEDGPAAISSLFQTNGPGTCMGDDAVNYPGNVSGFGTDPTAFNCTANDIRIANARTLSGEPIRCTEGEPILVSIVADVVQTSTSQRTDIGIWIAEDGGNAETGQCAHFYFEPPFTPPIASLDTPGDGCGDLENASTVSAFPLDDLQLICSDPDGDGLLPVGSCVSWTQPGGDRLCPAIIGDARAGTLPANKSKCNCEPFYITIEILPELTLEKVVINDDGGTLSDTDWTLTATGPETITGSEGDSDITGAGVEPGTYTLSESSMPGYAQVGNWACVDHLGASFPVSGGNQVTLASGNKVTCTVTNDDLPAHLTLVKVVVNDDGGTAVTTDWTLSATGPTPISGVTAAAAVTNAAVDAGTYALSESGPSGYTASSWVCVGGTQDGSNITLALDQSATCTITNDDDPAQLTLVKMVVNDNGGTAVPADWTLSAAGPTPISGVSGAPAVTNAAVDAGTYSLSESGGPSGYTASSWICVGGTQDGSNVTLALGQSATCTITNDDIQPKLTLVKTVINDNGGTLTVGDFPLFVGTTPVVSGVANGFNAGNYTASETQQAGYTASVWTGDCAEDGSVTLAVGNDKTCYITNDDDPMEMATETAYAFGDDLAICFSEGGFSQWGWTNNPIEAGTYTWEMYAGASSCDPETSGTYVGDVEVVYDGSTVTVDFNLLAGFTLESHHVYAGTTMFPMNNGVPTVAPGQYYIEEGLTGGSIYVIVHAVVGMPIPY